LKTNESINDTLNELLKFPLMKAIAGRRSRRFCMGAEIPDGVLAFKSKHDPLPLSEIEQLLLLCDMKDMFPNFLIILQVLWAEHFLQPLS
jgi:hypothetical protein